MRHLFFTHIYPAGAGDALLSAKGIFHARSRCRETNTHRLRGSTLHQSPHGHGAPKRADRDVSAQSIPRAERLAAIPDTAPWRFQRPRIPVPFLPSSDWIQYSYDGFTNHAGRDDRRIDKEFQRTEGGGGRGKGETPFCGRSGGLLLTQACITNIIRHVL